MAAELGVKWIHIPIVDHRGTNDRAAEDAISDLLDQAAAVLADPANQPIFFHCHHGLNRTSMVQIAYRTKYCGWTFEQAADEIDRTIGLVKVRHGPDYRHMVSFYENRVLPLRQPAARTTSEGSAGLSRPASKRPMRFLIPGQAMICSAMVIARVRFLILSASDNTMMNR